MGLAQQGRIALFHRQKAQFNDGESRIERGRARGTSVGERECRPSSLGLKVTGQFGAGRRLIVVLLFFVGGEGRVAGIGFATAALKLHLFCHLLLYKRNYQKRDYHSLTFLLQT